MTKQSLLATVLSLLLINDQTMADVNSASITTKTLEALPHCLHYRIRGLCYWLSDAGVINTTPYVEHYLPDLVVTVFNKPGDNPWTEIKYSYDEEGQAAEKQIVPFLTGDNAGSGQHSFADQHEQSVFFKEVDVIGNPALAVLPQDMVLLPSTVTPLLPYYQSMLDAAAWRGLPQVKTPLVEEVYAVVADVTHHIGSFPINWGGIYPHEGKIATSNDAKAAAVIAQRAGDLITSSNPVVIGHIYQSLSNQCGQECNAESIQENSDKTQFQMIYPIASNSCDYFGKTIHYGDNIESKTNGAYVWVVWRFYKGCVQGDGKYMGKTIN